MLVIAALVALITTVGAFRYAYRDEFFVDIQRVACVANRDLFPSLNPLHWTGPAYLLVAAIVAVLGGWRVRRSPLARQGRVRLTALVSALALVSSLLYSFTGFWNADTDESNGVAAATVFVVEGGQVPAALKPVTDGAKMTKNSRCLYTTVHNTASCIQATQDGVLTTDWEAPVNAKQARGELLSQRAPGVSMPETITYSYELNEWSMLRNGVDNRGMASVATWKGPGHKPYLCKFEGDHQLNYSFGGHWGTNLDNQIAKKFPTLRYNLSDASGYCTRTIRVNNGFDDFVPFIALPVTKAVPHGRVASPRAAGVLIVTGSPTGEPDIRHMSAVKAGEFPVPVYPKSLALKQRESINWAAGRGNMHDGFGYKVPRGSRMLHVHSAASGHDLLVTPLQERAGSSASQVDAYAVIVADESSVGMLAEQRVYVLPDPDVAGRMNGLSPRERFEGDIA